jgi:hypothetical protein
MFGANKEYFREHRRVVFDFDYWAHMRSSSRYTLNTHWTRHKTIGAWKIFPFGHILASVSLPTALITAFATACSVANYRHIGAWVSSILFLAAFAPLPSLSR